MTIIYTTLTDKAYADRLLDFMHAEEGERFEPYVDTNGIATIGWGFALNKKHAVAGVVDGILSEIIKLNPEGLSALAQEREAYYRSEILWALNASWPPSSKALLAVLNYTLTSRAAEIAGGGDYSPADVAILSTVKTSFRYDDIEELSKTFKLVEGGEHERFDISCSGGRVGHCLHSIFDGDGTHRKNPRLSAVRIRDRLA